MNDKEFKAYVNGLEESVIALRAERDRLADTLREICGHCHGDWDGRGDKVHMRSCDIARARLIALRGEATDTREGKSNGWSTYGKQVSR